MSYLYEGTIRSWQGLPLTSTELTVYTNSAGTIPASLMDVDGDAIANPTTTDDRGIVEVYCAAARLWYKITGDTRVMRLLRFCDLTQTGVGSVPFVDVVADFGADPTGSTDSTGEIQDAADTASAELIFFPSGTYLASGLTASADGQTWDLTSGATLRLADGANTNLVTITANNFSIRGGKLDGNAAAQTGGDYTDAVVKVLGAGNLSLIDVEIADAYTTALYLRRNEAETVAITNATIKGCRIYDCGLGAMLFSDVDGLVFSGNHVYEWAKDFVAGQQQSGDSCAGLSIWGGFGGNHRWAFSGNVFTGNATAVFGIESASSYTEEVVTDSSFTGNVFDSQGGRAGGFSGHFYHCTFSGNTHINGSGGLWSGYELVGRDLVVSGNVIGEGAICLHGSQPTGDAGRSYLISGNRVSTSAANGTCISFGTDAGPIYGVSVVGNHLTPTGTGSSAGIDCGFFGTAGVVTDALIANNTILGDDTAEGHGIGIYGAAGSTGIVISGNLVHGRHYDIFVWPWPYEWADEVTITGNDLRGNGTSLYGFDSVTGTYRIYQNVLADGQTALDVTGSRGGNAALADLLTHLAELGLITDSSS